jgi:hypothetical protein
LDDDEDEKHNKSKMSGGAQSSLMAEKRKALFGLGAGAGGT